MDFDSLSRRELQALCKRNKIPANVTNVAMADSLKALDLVEGVDEVLQGCKSEISQSSIEPRSRLEVTSPYVPRTGGRSTRQKDVLLTPAQSVATSRRRIAAKEDSALKQLYGTRRSARLAEKSAKLLQGVTEFSKKDLFTGDGQEFKMNLEKSLDGSVEVSGVTCTEESERTDEGQVDSSDKQDVSIDVELSPATEEEASNHSDNDGPQSKLKEAVDANTSVEVNFEAKDESKAEEVEVPKIEEEHHSTLDAKIGLNESRGAEIEQVGSGSETEDTKASHDETQKNDGLDAIRTSETKTIRVKAEIIQEKKIAEDAELVDETFVENGEDLAFASDTVIQSDGEIAFDENEEDLELNTDSSETKSNPDESDSVNDSMACMPSEISLMNGEDDVFYWDDNIKDVAVEEEQATAKQDVAASLENSPTHQLAVVVASNNTITAYMENAAVPSFIIQPTLSTPKRASASKAPARMIRVTSDSDNKENVGSGSKTAPAKERSKIVKEIAEAVPMLDHPSLMKRSKNLKLLAITHKLDKNEGENEASARTALQALSDNHKAI